MTKQEIADCLKLMSVNYGKSLDEDLMTLWLGLFANFNARTFQKACVEIIRSNKFFPNASEIINAYEYVKDSEKRAHEAEFRAQHKRLIDAQEYCCLCENIGFCFYSRLINGNEYEFAARCICSHGRNMSRFSHAQIDKNYKPEIRSSHSAREESAIKLGENPFYWATIKELLNDDDFEIFNARKKSKMRKVQKSCC